MTNASNLTPDDVHAEVLPTVATLGAASGQVMRSWPVPSTDIVASGDTVQVVIPPTSIPDGYVSSADVVNFDVQVTTDTARGVWQTSAQAAAVNGTPRWVALETVTRPTTVSSTARMALPKVARVTATGTPHPVAAQTMSLSPIPATATTAKAGRIDGSYGTFLTHDQCQHLWTLYYESGIDPSIDLVVSTKTVRPWATIGVTYPTANDRAWFGYSHGSGSGFESTFGVAVSAVPNLFEFHVDGAYKVTNSAGYGYESPHSTLGQAYRTQVKYRKIIMYRFPAPPPVGDGLPLSCERPYRTMWVPVAHTGNFLPKTGLTRPHYTHCLKEGAGTWWRSRSSGNDYEKSGGVKIAGVLGFNLKSSHQYSSESKIVYEQQRTEWLCGNNAYPLNAGKIMESTRKL